MTREEETSCKRKRTKFSPHSAKFGEIPLEETEQGQRREACHEDFKIIEHLGKGGFG
jgi:hypothetical protein